MPYMWNDRKPVQQADGSMSAHFNVSSNGIFTLFVEEIKVDGVPPGVVAHILVAGVSTARTFFPCRKSETEEDMEAAFKKGREFCELVLVSTCAAALAAADDNNFRMFDGLLDDLSSKGHIETSKKIFETLRKAMSSAEPTPPQAPLADQSQTPQ